MADSPITISPTHPARMKLEPYTVELHLQGINVGLDNIHYDVYLSPKFTEPTRKYLLDSIRAIASRDFSPPESARIFFSTSSPENWKHPRMFLMVPSLARGTRSSTSWYAVLVGTSRSVEYWLK